MDALRPVLLVSGHEDSADLYSYALEQAGYTVQCVPSPAAAVAMLGNVPPLAIVVQVMPQHDAVALGALLREGRPDTVLVGLFSMQLPMSALKQLLEVFDDIVLIPCAPDALVSRIKRLEQLKKREREGE